MSSYLKETKNPATGKWEEAEWLDDHFGKHNYGVKFADGSIVNPDEIELETRAEKKTAPPRTAAHRRAPPRTAAPTKPAKKKPAKKPAKKKAPKKEKPEKKVNGPLINAKINEVMKKVGVIEKTHFNDMQEYNYRSIDDIYNTMHDLLAEAELFVTSEITAKEHVITDEGTRVFISMKWSIHAADGSFISTETSGEGEDLTDKATKIAMSGAYKYAFLQLFCIPTEEAKDGDDPRLTESANAATEPLPPAPDELAPKTTEPKTLLGKKKKAWDKK